MKREARLKPEHAHFYPGITPGIWEGAGVLADKVLACRLLMPSGGFVLNERALQAEHFEFRGGTGPRLAAPDRLALDPRGTASDSALSGR
ncbi:MAG TPA: hypothetical protein VMY76_15105 [Gemmatimonadales bacterium]|nr:hypothetical protein [Gemmatimonadales bacterium]